MASSLASLPGSPFKKATQIDQAFALGCCPGLAWKTPPLNMHRQMKQMPTSRLKSLPTPPSHHNQRRISAPPSQTRTESRFARKRGPRQQTERRATCLAELAIWQSASAFARCEPRYPQKPNLSERVLTKAAAPSGTRHSKLPQSFSPTFKRARVAKCQAKKKLDTAQEKLKMPGRPLVELCFLGELGQGRRECLPRATSNRRRNSSRAGGLQSGHVNLRRLQTD